MRPQKTVVASRSVCNTTAKLGQHSLKMPVYAANMRSVVNSETCEFFARQGWFYTMHRFGINALSFTNHMHAQGLIASISVGIQESDETLISSFSSGNAPEFITIDIANAYADRVMRVIGFIKSKLPNTFVIAGNVATPEAVEALHLWGADAIKVGVAGGCFIPDSLVRTKTGFKKISQVSKDDQVITHTGCWQKISNIFQYYRNEKLISINGITSTKNHEYYVLHKKYKDMVTDSNLFLLAEWLPASHLTNEYLLIKHK